MIETVITTRGVVPAAESLEGVDPTAAAPIPPNEPQPILPFWGEHLIRARAGSDEAIAVYAQARGRVAIDETDGQIRHIVRLFRESLVAQNNPATFRGALKEAVAIQADYREYVDRARRLGKLLKIKYTPPALPELPSAALLLDRADSAGGPVRVQIASALESQRAELARCERDVQRLTRVFDTSAAITEAGRIRPAESFVFWGSRQSYITKGPVEGWPPDLCIRDLDEAFAERQRISDQGVALAQDETRAASVVSGRVTAAIEVGGGAELIVECMKAALVDSDRWLESATDWPVIDKSRKAIATLESRLAKAPLRSLLAAGLQMELGGFLSSLKELEQSAETERTGQLTALLKSASSGAEDARAAVEQIIDLRPEAFPVDFPAAIRASNFDRVVLAELSHVLTSQ